MLFLLILLIPFFSFPVFAQEASTSASNITPSPVITQLPTLIPTPTNHPNEDLYQKYVTDYLFLRDAYEKDYLVYVEKSRIYTKYGTTTTQKEKIDAVKTVAVSLNKMVKAYLMAIRVRLDVYQQSNPTDTETLKIEISKQESWLDEQIQIVNSINNEADFNSWVKTFNTNYIKVQTDFYTAFVIQEINSKKIALNEIQNLSDKIQNLPNYNVNSPAWINNLAIKTDLIKDYLDSSFKLTQAKQDKKKFNNFYPSAKKNFAKSTTYFEEIVNDLKSVISKSI